MANYLVKSIIDDGNFRAYAVNSTNVVAEAQQRHDTRSASSAALGRTLTATLLLSTSLMKGQESMTVKVQGDGPAKGIVVDADANGHVKGYIVNPRVHLPLNDKGHIDVGAAVGKNGALSVTKNLGLDKPYTGQVALVSGEIGDDFTYYLAQSEQIPSAVGVSVFVEKDNSIGVAGGFMIQVLPGASDKAISELEASLKDLPQVSQLLRDGKTPEDILNDLFGKERVKVLERVPVSFQCDCSKDKFAKDLASLPDKDLKDMITEDHGAEAVCRFCGNKYQFSEQELQTILSEKNA
ncbi:Hsp33 family molecular chaperone HslO [Furfurilactobacillus rossiae]|uniref:33 kDa chaperonin n=1 Tax=Furfurilactobacillus rossiae DSM 15814 TaxID=1114972 RepID=A0A0R1RF42_9LACO|nr:Hsp33 family molecular chaperone HslO [Furfurilactobacillus rossiae]KRL54969.1 chaperonin HslO [Furfurilactobacillus rossiae DSM 15814]QFR67808.1 Hsp33 family molecular chaperone HslO [Furfurilactobacillus rossiae]QLE60784.1 Chaperonin heat shock protein [Furfurilactobacillus rossiae]